MGKHWQKFPAETTALLFQAVEEDDVIGAGDSLPACAEFGYPSLVLYENYALCLQFWEEGCHRKELLALINTFLKNSNQPLAVRMRYKYIRARYKHLRCPAAVQYRSPARSFAEYDDGDAWPLSGCLPPRESGATT